MEKCFDLSNNPMLNGLAMLIPDVEFARADGVSLKMALIAPKWTAAEYKIPHGKCPLIVFLQGSGWTFPNIYNQIPQLSRFAQQGYVVATITHRNCLEGHPFPAYLEDAKTAIRFLRAHAEEYSIDPERVCFFGTSSGGNTALLVGLTPDDPKYKGTLYPEQSDRVQVIIDCFGPADVLTLPIMRRDFPMTPALVGKREQEEVFREMSPLHHVEAGKPMPPMLLMHGDRDEVVPFDQSERMFEALNKAGCDATFVHVRGAEHEGSFWSATVWDLIDRYLKEHL